MNKFTKVLAVASLLLNLSVKAADLVQNQNNNKVKTKTPPKVDTEGLGPGIEIFGSGWSGNGGDNHHVQENIWFLGEQAIPYCIKTSDDYSLNERELSDLVSESINDWKKFFDKYQLNKALAGKKLRLQFPDNLKRRMSLNFIKSDCSLAQEQGIEFYFGKKDQILKAYTALNSESALGLAIRKRYNHATYRNPGKIWVSNFTKERNKIKHVLLHELGHAFGMGHDSAFVMDEDMVLKLQNDKFPTKYFGSIEAPFWKYRITTGESIELASRLKLDKRRLDLLDNDNRLPREISRAVEMKRSKDSAVYLTLENNRNKKMLFSLTFTSEYESRTVHGLFKSSRIRPLNNMGPGVFTRLKAEEKGMLARRLVADKKPFNLPARGHFKIGKTLYPARITDDKGVHLEIYLESAKKWWSLSPITKAKL